MFAVAAGVALATLAGASVLVLLGVRLTHWEWIALAPGVGSGAITIAMFAALAAGASFAIGTRTAVVLVLVVALGAAAAWRMRRSSVVFDSPRAVPSTAAERRISWLLASLVAALVGSSFAMALYWPPHAWDALTVWVLKARMLQETGKLSSVGATAGVFYPLHIPLQLALLLPGVRVSALQTIFPIYFLLLLLLAGGWVRRHAAPVWSLAVAALAASTPTVLDQSSIAMADVMFAYYYVASVLMLALFAERGDVRHAALSGLLVGIACWTRADGLLYFAINLILLAGLAAARRRSVLAIAAFAVCFAPFWWPWRAYLDAQGWTEHFTPTAAAALRDTAGGVVHWQRLDIVLRYLERQWTSFGVWGATWLAFALALPSARHAARHATLLAAIVLNLAGLVFTYYAYYRPDALGWALDTGFVRMATHFTPLLWVYAGLAAASRADAGPG